MYADVQLCMNVCVCVRVNIGSRLTGGGAQYRPHPAVAIALILTENCELTEQCCAVQFETLCTRALNCLAVGRYSTVPFPKPSALIGASAYTVVMRFENTGRWQIEHTKAFY